MRHVPQGNEPRLLLPSLEPFYRLMRPLSWPILRMAVGCLLVVHGFGKIGRTAGPGQLVEKLPASAAIGAEITFVLMVIEFVGGICIALGLFTRFFAAAAAVEMAVLTFYIYWGTASAGSHVAMSSRSSGASCFLRLP